VPLLENHNRAAAAVHADAIADRASHADASPTAIAAAATYMTAKPHQEAAKEFARASTDGMGSKTAFLRHVSRKVGKVIRPGTIAAEQSIMAYLDERERMISDRNHLAQLERLFTASL
jgi:hypothetical protein